MDWTIQFDKAVEQYLPDLEMVRDEPMSRHTTFRIGGPAKRMAYPASREQMVLLISFARECGAEPLVIGNGSNLLVPDEGLNRLVINTSAHLNRVEQGAENTIIADAGATLARTADQMHLNTPWTIPVIYLGFGAGLAVFMFTGFVKSLPLEIEEAAAIDGCGPVGTFFRVVLPMLKPTMISVGVLEIMWVWNDYLLPSLVLDINQYRTIPIHIQYLKGSYGTVDMGATMALIMLSILPVIIFYLCCQKHIIKGVAAGAVKG